MILCPYSLHLYVRIHFISNWIYCEPSAEVKFSSEIERLNFQVMQLGFVMQPDAGAAAGQLHLFQKRVLSYRVMLATKWRLPPRIETNAQRAPRRPESVEGPGGRSTCPDNTRRAPLSPCAIYTCKSSDEGLERNSTLSTPSGRRARPIS